MPSSPIPKKNPKEGKVQNLIGRKSDRYRLFGYFLPDINTGRQNKIFRGYEVLTNSTSVTKRPPSGELVKHQYTTRMDDSFESQDSIMTDKPLCIALYDFEAENYGELTIVEGQKVELLSQPDDEWFEGRVDGKIGFFPIRYVRVIVPLR